MSYRRITVTASTIGQSNPSQVSEGKPYRYRGDPDWTPGDARYLERARSARKMPAGSGGDANATARQKRLDVFTAALTALGYPDPARAPDSAVIEAGIRTGVGDRTAKSYRTALRQRQRGETADA